MTAEQGHGIPYSGAVRVWARIAALSFGGPAGQIAVMHRILVEEKRWFTLYALFGRVDERQWRFASLDVPRVD